MHQRTRIFIIFLFFLLYISCQNNNSGICFTFDDQHVLQWYNSKELFKKYNIKATFFINRPQNLTPEQVTMLKELQLDGHEIACHSINHINLVEFLKTHTIKEYLDQEIVPAIEKMKELGFSVQSYAYPFGLSTPEADKELLKYFKILRKATYNIENTTLDKIDRTFTKIGSSRVIDAMGVDNQYCITLDNLELGMKRANSKNEVLILHAHKIVERDSGYSISVKYLEDAFKLSQKYNLKPILISNLY